MRATGSRPWLALRKRPAIAAIIALCIVALLALLVFWLVSGGEDQPAPQVSVEDAVAEILAAQPEGPAISSLVNQVILPSLVVVQTDEEGREDLFGLGSGVVINRDGHVLTAHHIVDGSREIRVAFADGTRTSAFVVNAVPERDIAVLAPASPPELVVPATIGSPAALRVGDEVFAVGNPLGLVASLSAGVVSGLDRQSTPHGREQPVQGLIQFDASVNPGNSGGPLLNRGGQVVGIVTGLMNPTEDDVFIGIGFAVPIDVAAGAAGGPPQ